MFDHICSKSTAAATADALREFAGNHREALLSAANLLGGPDASRAAAEALEALASEKVPSRSTRRRFEALLELLSLENVHDEPREEAARFAAIDPGDPRVEEICLLTDLLRDALERATTDDAPASRRAAA
jgi:hypothetical protein